MLALGAGLRLHALDAESYWLDELYSLMTSGGYVPGSGVPIGVLVERPVTMSRIEEARPAGEILSALRHDIHPPLYFLLLRAWREAFGDGEAAARSLSLLFSLAGIVLLFDAMRVPLGTAAGLWAALLMALAGPQIRYAQEVRSYALLQVFLLGAMGALARLEAAGPASGPAVTLGACALLAMLTHYHGQGFLAGLGLYALVDLEGRARRQALAVFGAAALLFGLVWGPMLWTQRRLLAGATRWTLVRPGDAAPPILERLATMPAELLWATRPALGRSAAWQGVAYVLIALVVWRRRSTRAWAAAGAGAVAVVAAIARRAARSSWGGRATCSPPCRSSTRCWPEPAGGGGSGTRSRPSPR